MRTIEVSDALYAALEAKAAHECDTVPGVVERALQVCAQEWGSVSYVGDPGNYYEVVYQSKDCLWDEFARAADKLGLSVEQALAEIAKGHDGSQLSGKSGFFKLESLSHFLGDDVPLRHKGQLTIPFHL